MSSGRWTVAEEYKRLDEERRREGIECATGWIGLDAAAQNSLKDTTERNRSDMVMAGDMERDQRERKSIHLPSREIGLHFLIRSG
jgi:hypothetical protein